MSVKVERDGIVSTLVRHEWSCRELAPGFKTVTNGIYSRPYYEVWFANAYNRFTSLNSAINGFIQAGSSGGLIFKIVRRKKNVYHNHISKGSVPIQKDGD